MLLLHRSHRQLVKFRTTQINALHGILLEFGETIQKGRAALERISHHKLEDQYNRLSELDSLIDGLEKKLNSVARQNETCKRLMEIPGVGPLIGIAAVATTGEASVFKS